MSSVSQADMTDGTNGWLKCSKTERKNKMNPDLMETGVLQVRSSWDDRADVRYEEGLYTNYNETFIIYIKYTIGIIKQEAGAVLDRHIHRQAPIFQQTKKGIGTSDR